VVPTVLLAADITVLYLALPHLSVDLRPTSTETLWIIHIYGCENTDGGLTRIEDRSHGVVCTEARCAACDAHLGHVFPDQPTATRERYCMNSASLCLDPPKS
jgi:hypothetical protein